MQSRARQCLAMLAVAFAAVQIVVGFVVAHVPRWFDPWTGATRARLRERCSVGHPLVVMLGSSRTKSGFRAGDVEGALADECSRPVRVANLAVSGGGPFTALLTLNRMLDEGLRPTLLLVDVTPVFLNAREEPSELRSDRLFSRHLRSVELARVARARGTSVSGEWAGWLTAWAVPAYSFRTEIFLSFASRMVPAGMSDPEPDAWGWAPFPAGDSPAERQRLEQVTRQTYADRLGRFELGGPNVDALRNLLRICRDHQIPVTLVVTPEAPEFREMYRPADCRQFEAWLEALRSEFRVPIVNARDWFGREDFMDLHHLHPETARRYTQRLLEKVIRPAMAKEQAIAGR